jgi:type IV fimbrial biogenesis protein FimT
MRPKQAATGFTLIEMMVAIGIMAILLSIAVPSFTQAGLGSQLRSSSTAMIASANLARSEAVKRNAPVNLCVSADGASCGAGGWEQGWIVMVPSLPAGQQVIARGDPAPQGFRIMASSSTTTVTFQPTGVGATAASFKICRQSPNAGHQERLVTIDAAGKAASRQTTTGTCS